VLVYVAREERGVGPVLAFQLAARAEATRARIASEGSPSAARVRSSCDTTGTSTCRSMRSSSEAPQVGAKAKPAAGGYPTRSEPLDGPELGKEAHRAPSGRRGGDRSLPRLRFSPKPLER
jgi:hypothetical protein